jgi:hypothetical protein
MITIWKFKLPILDSYALYMPKGAEVLTVQAQGGQPCLWAIVDTDAENEVREFEVCGTGNPIYQNLQIQRKYIGTFQSPPFVWHVFERTN